MLTRKDLKDLGLEDAQIESIISKHTDTVTALKERPSDGRGNKWYGSRSAGRAGRGVPFLCDP